MPQDEKHPSKVLYTLVGFREQPSLEVAAKALDMSPEELDGSFGVVPLDPERGLFCIQLSAERSPGPNSDPKVYSGPWSDLPIRPLADEDEDRSNPGK